MEPCARTSTSPSDYVFASIACAPSYPSTEASTKVQCTRSMGWTVDGGRWTVDAPPIVKASDSQHRFASAAARDSLLKLLCILSGCIRYGCALAPLLCSMQTLSGQPPE